MAEQETWNFKELNYKVHIWMIDAAFDPTNIWKKKIKSLRSIIWKI